MKRIVFSILFFISSITTSFAASTAFAIFVDNTTYEHCSAEILAYQKVLEAEGLKVSIHASNWQSPDEVKSEILALASNKKCPLEGAVFIGEVPIVMVRGAQHMTTAFKMNEEVYPREESSVASDRFYDDFDLQFDFIARDTIDCNRFFYRLNEKGAQKLKPEIYTGRIRVPEFMKKDGQDPYKLISKYLLKAIEAHMEYNVLDYMTFFYGSGYNSEDLNVWREKIFASYEEFPYTEGRAEQHRFLNFHQNPQMKWTLFSELQREQTDFFQFSEHGAYDTQYINGSTQRPTLEELVTGMKLSILSSRRGRAYLDSLAQYIDSSEFTEDKVRSMQKADSIKTRHKDLYQEEIAAIKSNPRIVILNACYNNSFHNPEGYVAGAHIFSDGRCVVAQGNTVNVLQDKYENRLVGLLSMGVRVGQWQKEVSYLEAHLAGDPTFRFSPMPKDARLAVKINKALISNDSKIWRSLLKSENPIARAAAIGHLEDHALAMKYLSEDASPMVRMTALNVLYYSDLLEKALLIALNDNYELITRHAVRHACKYCDTNPDSELLAAVRRLVDYHPEMVRLQYYASNLEQIASDDSRYKSDIQTFANTSLPIKRRINAARTFRNNNYVPAISHFISVIADNSDELSIRLVCAEALGWYDMSIARKGIIASLSAIDKEALPEELKAEITKTIKRLEYSCEIQNI